MSASQDVHFVTSSTKQVKHEPLQLVHVVPESLYPKFRSHNVQIVSDLHYLHPVVQFVQVLFLSLAYVPSGHELAARQVFVEES